MTNKSLEMLKWLLEDLETDEGVCYKTRSSTCATACPLWYAGAFGDNICLPSVLGRRVTRMIHDIEVITLPYGAALICNEEGRILGLPDNGRVCGVDVVGTVLIVGTKGEEFCDVPAFMRAVQHA